MQFVTATGLKWYSRPGEPLLISYVMNLKGKNMDSLEKENERLKIQNEILKESVLLLTKRVEYYKDKYERVVLDLKEMGK